MSEISSQQSNETQNTNIEKYKKIKKHLKIYIILYISFIVMTIAMEIVCLSLSNKKDVCQKGDEFNLNYVFGMAVHLSFFILLYILILICLYITKDELYDYCCSLCNFYIVFFMGLIGIIVTLLLIYKCKNNMKIVIFSSIKILTYLFLFVFNYIILWYYKYDKYYTRNMNIMRRNNDLFNIQIPIILTVNINGNQERIILYNSESRNFNSENFGLNREDEIKKIINKCTQKEYKIENNNQNQNKETCTICLQEFKNSEKILVLPCKHYFHIDCIKNWFEKNLTCPLDNLSLRNLVNE
jgi:hypothetical protein